MLSDKIIGWPKDSPYQNVEDLESRARHIYEFLEQSNQLPIFLGKFLMLFANSLLYSVKIPKSKPKDKQEDFEEVDLGDDIQFDYGEEIQEESVVAESVLEEKIDCSTLLPRRFASSSEKEALESFQREIDKTVMAAYMDGGEYEEGSPQKVALLFARSRSFFSILPDRLIHLNLVSNEILAQIMREEPNEKRKSDYLSILIYRNAKLLTTPQKQNNGYVHKITEDMFQRCMYVLAQYLSKYDPTKGAFSTWYVNILKKERTIQIRERYGDTVSAYKVGEVHRYLHFCEEFIKKNHRKPCEEEVLVGMKIQNKAYETILLNLNLLSKSADINELIDLAVPGTPEEDILQREESAEIQSVISDMFGKAEKNKDTAFIAWYRNIVDGWTFEEIAKDLNIPKNAVSKLVREGRIKVEGKFEQKGVESSSRDMKDLFDKAESFRLVLDESSSVSDYAQSIIDDMMG